VSAATIAAWIAVRSHLSFCKSAGHTPVGACYNV